MRSNDLAADLLLNSNLKIQMVQLDYYLHRSWLNRHHAYSRRYDSRSMWYRGTIRPIHPNPDYFENLRQCMYRYWRLRLEREYHRNIFLHDNTAYANYLETRPD